jgi:Flp pilus assembly pilin Flp
MRPFTRVSLTSLLRDEEGASLVEYILLAVLIGVAAIAGLSFLGGAANNRMNNIATTISQQPS